MAEAKVIQQVVRAQRAVVEIFLRRGQFCGLRGLLGPLKVMVLVGF
jgi:hypothetical protein